MSTRTEILQAKWEKMARQSNHIIGLLHSQPACKSCYYTLHAEINKPLQYSDCGNDFGIHCMNVMNNFCTQCNRNTSSMWVINNLAMELMKRNKALAVKLS